MHPYLAQALVEARIDELNRSAHPRSRRSIGRLHHITLRRHDDRR